MTRQVSHVLCVRFDVQHAGRAAECFKAEACHLDGEVELDARDAAQCQADLCVFCTGHQMAIQ